MDGFRHRLMLQFFFEKSPVLKIVFAAALKVQRSLRNLWASRHRPALPMELSQERAGR